MIATIEQIRIVIVEDQELVRFGLNLSLSAQENLAVVGQAENGEQGLEIALDTRPDIVLMDIAMPIMDGLKAAQILKQQVPEIKIIMLTSNNNVEEVLSCLSAGADAYCLKDIRMERLSQVIHMVKEGAMYLDPAIAKLAMQTLSPLQEDSEPKKSCEKSSRIRYNVDLTEREQEVLQLIVEGRSNKEIAAHLQVTIHTAKAHVANIIQKFSVDDRTQVAVKALRDRLL